MEAKCILTVLWLICALKLLLSFTTFYMVLAPYLGLVFEQSGRVGNRFT